jgi:hypothetical protein
MERTDLGNSRPGSDQRRGLHRWIFASRPGAAALAALALSGCAPEAKPRSTPADSPAVAVSASPPEINLERFRSRSVGQSFSGKPWISHVTTADLDRDGRTDILACDDKRNAVVWLRQTAPGTFAESTLRDQLPAPVHAEVVDFDQDGDADVIVACMGQVFPNNDKIGALILLENDGKQGFSAHPLLEQVARVTDARAGDFDGDGRLDLAVAQFGYNQGEVRWMRNLGGNRFESQVLLSLPGAINVCIADFNGDRAPDIAALISQNYEEIYLFENSGFGTFTQKIIFGSTNEDYGSSGISVCDLNRDGRPDILYSNGDGFAYADPGKRPWHGVQWLENRGQGFFKYHRIGDMDGAYSPIAVDLENRGVMDVICVSGFNDWKNPRAASLVLFRNDGQQRFTRTVLAHQPIQMISVAAGDLDGSGRPSLVTGSFYAYPPFENMARLTLWTPPTP